MMRRLSVLALTSLSFILLAGFSPSLHAQVQNQPLTGFTVSSSPNPVGYELTTTLTASTSGSYGVPDGSIDFYNSSSMVSCTANTNDIGTVAVGANGITTLNHYVYLPGTFPICANYIPGPSHIYAASTTAAVSTLTVYQPTLFTVNVPSAALTGALVTFTFGLTTPAGQPAPTGTISLEDPNNSYAVVGTANVTGGIVSNPIITTLAGSGYYAVYNGDGNYAAQSVSGQVLFESGLNSIYPASVTAGSSDTNFTLIGQGFTSASQVQLLTPGALVSLPVNSFTPTQIVTTVPATYLQNLGELNIEVITGLLIGGPVQLQVYFPSTDSTTVSATPSTFPYGATGTAIFNATVSRGAPAIDPAVPSGQVSFTLTGTGYSATLGTAQLSQVSTPGTYLSPFTEQMDQNSSAKLVAADLNGDGFVDVIGMPGVYPGSPAVSPYLQVMLSTGVNAFQTEQEVFVGCAAQDFAVGDISGDAIPDLVVVCSTNGYASSNVNNLIAYYMLGNGDGTFQAPVAFGGNSLIGTPTQVVLGQFNNDGYLDIAVIDGANGNLQVISPFGDAGNPYGPEIAFNLTDGYVVSAVAADFNHDNLTDIVLEEYAYNYGYGALLVLLSNGNYNGFTLKNQPSFNASSQTIQSMTVTDVNGDGYPDVAIADPGTPFGPDYGNLLVFENDATGNLNQTFTQPINSVGSVAGVPFPTIGQPAPGAAASPGWNLVYTYIGNDSNLWVGEVQRQSAASWTVLNTFDTYVGPVTTDGGILPDFLVTGDMNGDGYLDFAMNASPSQYLYELLPWYASNDAQATLNGTSQLPTPGNYTLSMNYPGNLLYQSNPDASTAITITQATPGGSVVGPGTVTFGTSVTLNATVIGVTGGAAPAGSVTFYDGGNALQTVGLTPGSGLSTASMQSTQFGLGSHNITISYTGDANYLATGTLASTTLQVNATSISLQLSSSTVSTTAGTVVTFQVQASGSALPAGQAITLTGLPTAANFTTTLNASGFGSIGYGLFPSGNYTIQASFAGNANFGAATSNSVSLQVNPTPVSVSLTPSANPVTYPATFNLSSNVTSGGLGVPLGSISFQNNGTQISTGTLATVNGSSGLASVGTFDTIAAQTDIAVVHGDFNKDGNQDIAVLQRNATNNAVTLLVSLGNGDGTFQAPATYAVAAGLDATAVSLAAADFNNDGYTDLVVAASDGAVTVFFAKGDAAGDLVMSQQLTVPGALAVATGDFNHDGNQDFAVVSATTVTAFYGTGNTPANFPTAGSWNSTFGSGSFTGITVADFNHDGFADIAISDNGGPDVAVLLYDAEISGFDGPQTYPVGISASALAAGDVNGDGYPDLAVVSNLDSTVNVLINGGVGAPGTFTAGTSYGVANGPTAVAMNDFNQDGYADIAVAGAINGQGGGTTILLGSSTGAMTGETSLSTAYGQSITTADFNNDSNPDLAVGNNGITSFIDSSTQAGVNNIALSVGTAPLTAVFQPANSALFSGSTSPTVNEVVNQATPVIFWSNPAAITFGTALSATQLNATASVPGTFTYTPPIGTVLDAGTQQQLSVSFVPNDTVDYVGTTATVLINVNQATTTITWASPAAITYGTALSATQLNATASVPGTFTYTPPLGTTLNAGSQTLRVNFTPTDATDYAASTDSVQLQVNQATPVITWNTPAAITYGVKLSATQLNATASTPGTFAYSPAAGTLPTAGTHTLAVTFTPTDTVDYTTANASVQLDVNQAAPVITWANPAPITYGTTLSATQLDATATPAGGTFTYTPALGATLPVGAQTLRVSYTPTDTVDYTTVSAQVPITVNQAATTVTWATPAAITYGTALSTAQLNATASVPGSFSYTPALGTILGAGTQTLNVTFTPTDTTDYTGSTGTVQLQVNQATPVITWNAPAAITYGTKLSATQLNATASTPGTFVYTPALGTTPTAGLQTLTVKFTPTDAVDYATANSSVQIQVNQAVSLITWPNPAAITYGTKLSATQLDATATPAGGTFTYTPPAGTTLTVGTQTLRVSYVPTDTVDYASATAQATITVTAAATTITWATPAAIAYGTALSAAQLNASASVPGTFTYTPALGTILGAGSQTLRVNFTPTDSTDYTASTTTVQLQVNQATPVLTWSTPAAITYGTKLSATQLNATASVPGTLTYTPAAGTTLTAGTQTLKVNFAPTDAVDYAATSSTVQLQVNQANPAITWNAPAAITYGTKLSATQLNATASTPGTFVYTPALGTTPTAGLQTLTVKFTPTDAVDYATATASVQLQVNQATSVITWPNPAAITYGTTLGAAQLNATATPAGGTFTYTPPAGTTLTAGTQTLRVSYVPTDTVDYAGATAQATITVNAAATTVTWATPAAIAYGTALSAAQLNASASVPGTFTYTPALGTILGAGSQTLRVNFTPSDSTDYTASSTTVQLQVNQATPVITWSTPAAIIYGTKLSATQLNATASVPGTLTYTPAAGTTLTAGTQTLKVNFAPTDAVDYAATSSTVQLQVNQATPVITWTAPAAITYGTKLSATQLNATASTPGTFAYTPALGTTPTAGLQTLTVKFTPTDAVDYATATSSVQLQVNQAASLITWANPAAITYGTTLSATQLNATATPAGGTFTYTPPAGTTLSAGAQTLHVSYTPTDTVDYTNATAQVPITVNASATTITWPTPAAITYGTALSATQLNATASVPGTFTYTPALGTVLTAGAQTLKVSFTPTDSTDYTASTSTVQLEVNQATPVITWNAPAAITYGTKLGAAQLNATTPTAGTFTYTPAAGTTLPAGSQTLKVNFAPTDTVDYTAAASSVQIQVNQATPVITWSNPATITYGTALSATQLNATASVPGTLTYTPASGAILSVGTQTLNVNFVPTDTIDYTSASDSVSIQVLAGLALSSILPTSANYGSAATTITLTGTGFSTNSIVQLNGTTITSSFVSSTQMTAVIPATFLQQTQPGAITVTNPATQSTTAAVTFTVLLPNIQIVFTGPSTESPGQQPSLSLQFLQGYPLPLQVTLTLSVAPATAGGAVDPAVQFSTGGSTFSFALPANSTTTPAIQLQTGTLPSTITVTLTLESGGQDLTPEGLAPVVIKVPTTAPVITSVTLARSGSTLTVTVQGYSSPQDMTNAVFSFTAAAGSTLDTPQLTVDVATDFASWYTQATSTQYGSAFTYTQTFDVSGDASSIGSVGVTLTNSVGTSNSVSAN